MFKGKTERTLPRTKMSASFNCEPFRSSFIKLIPREGKIYILKREKYGTVIWRHLSSAIIRSRTLSEEKNSNTANITMSRLCNRTKSGCKLSVFCYSCGSLYEARNRGKRIEVAASLTLARSLYPEIESTGLPTVLQTEITRLWRNGSSKTWRPCQ